MLTQIRKSFCSSSHASCVIICFSSEFFFLAVEFSFALFKLLKMFEQNKESGAVFIGMELAWVERQLQPDLGFQLFTAFENLGRLVQRVYAELAAA